MKRSPPLFLLWSTWNPGIPTEMVQYLDTVRTANQWNELGIRVNQPHFERDGQWYYLEELKPSESVLDAAASGKRLAWNRDAAASAVLNGIPLSDYIGLSEDAVELALAAAARKSGDLLDAEQHLRRVVQLVPGIPRYRDALFDVRLARGDVTTVADALEFYEADLDTAVRLGMTTRWLRVLIEAGAFEQCAITIEGVVAGLTRLERGDEALCAKRIYKGGSEAEWAEAARSTLDRFGRDLPKAVFPGKGRLTLLQGEPSQIIALAECVIRHGRDLQPNFVARVAASCREWGRPADAARYERLRAGVESEATDGKAACGILPAAAASSTSMTLRFEVAGAGYVPGIREILERLGPRVPLRLVRDPSNSFDSNATNVQLQDGTSLGFVPKKKLEGTLDGAQASSNADLARFLDAGGQILAQIGRVGPGTRILVVARAASRI